MKVQYSFQYTECSFHSHTALCLGSLAFRYFTSQHERKHELFFCSRNCGDENTSYCVVDFHRWAALQHVAFSTGQCTPVQISVSFLASRARRGRNDSIYQGPHDPMKSLVGWTQTFVRGILRVLPRSTAHRPSSIITQHRAKRKSTESVQVISSKGRLTTGHPNPRGRCWNPCF